MSAPKDLADLAQRFDADRRHLTSVAFHLLGSTADPDDAVQSAWLKASRSGLDSITNVANLTGWFTTITAHEAVDQLRVRRRRAEQPIADLHELDRLARASAPADDDVLLADSVSRAMVAVLDRLSPAQRVAFVLHDLFAVPFDTIEAFLAASRGGDVARLLDLLAPDVVRRVDRALVRGPDSEGVPTELRGSGEVAGETRRFAQRARAGAVMLIDGLPGIVIAPRGRPQVLLQIGIGADNRIHTIDITGDADRLRRAVLALPRRDAGNTPGRGYRTRPAAGQDRKHHAR